MVAFCQDKDDRPKPQYNKHIPNRKQDCIRQRRGGDSNTKQAEKAINMLDLVKTKTQC